MDKAHDNWIENLVQESLKIFPVTEAVAIEIRAQLNENFQHSTLTPTEIKKIAHSLLKITNVTPKN